MFHNLKSKFELAKLQCNRQRLLAKYRQELTEAEAKHETPEQIASLTHDYRFETDMLDDEIALTITHHWISKAERLYLPTPPRDEPVSWKHTTQIPDRQVLTEIGLRKIRSDLRAERKAQMDTWLPLATTIIGIIGAIIGLIAMLKGGGSH